MRRAVAGAKAKAEAEVRETVNVEMRNVRHSESELLGLQEATTVARDKLIAQGIVIHGTEVSSKTNRLEISVEAFTPGKAAELKKQFGDAVNVTPWSPPANGAKSKTYDRAWDSAPYSAGIFINWANCTLGHPILFQGYRFMVTASHCVSDGSAVENGNGRIIGYAQWVDHGQTDSAIVTAPGYLGVFTTLTDQIYNMSTLPWNSRAGEWVCVSGAYTNNVWGQVPLCTLAGV